MSAYVREEKKELFKRVELALQEANFASSIAVQREGSMASVPTLEEVHRAMQAE